METTKKIQERRLRILRTVLRGIGFALVGAYTVWLIKQDHIDSEDAIAFCIVIAMGAEFASDRARENDDE